MEDIRGKKKPVVLVIMDGWGEWDNIVGNAVACAELPTIKKLNKRYPKILLDASGPSVGLPWGVFGNSEVGHQTIGSGQIVFQYLPVIDFAIQNGGLEQKQVLIDCFSRLKREDKALHIWGLCSDGGVHSDIAHLLKIMEAAKKGGVGKIYIHVVTDGRDTNPQISASYVRKINNQIASIGVGKIATIGGRFYAMDRNENWDRIEKAYRAMVDGDGEKGDDPLKVIEDQYKKDVYDEYLVPTVIVGADGEPVGRMEDGDALICFNYRKDRARQMTKAFVENGFDKFRMFRNVKIEYICMAEYEEGLCDKILFEPQKITTRVGGVISEGGLTQLRIAETEKFAHVTYFFNGGYDTPFPGEERIFVPSKNCKSYADMPEMSAYEVTEKLLQAIDSEKFDFILVNYANSDMVGHTGVFEAGVKACETVDFCLDKVIKAVLGKDGCLIVTADHGNVEEMINAETGAADTEHSTNPVPCWLVAKEYESDIHPLPPGPYSMSECVIADLAPTILDLLGLDVPEEMHGKSLLEVFDRRLRA